MNWITWTFKRRPVRREEPQREQYNTKESDRIMDTLRGLRVARGELEGQRQFPELTSDFEFIETSGSMEEAQGVVLRSLRSRIYETAWALPLGYDPTSRTFKRNLYTVVGIRVQRSPKN